MIQDEGEDGRVGELPTSFAKQERHLAGLHLQGNQSESLSQKRSGGSRPTGWAFPFGSVIGQGSRAGVHKFREWCASSLLELGLRKEQPVRPWLGSVDGSSDRVTQSRLPPRDPHL